MSKRSQLVLAFSPFAALALAVAAHAAPLAGSGPQTARLATFTKSSGETYFALSLKPTVEAASAESSEVLVLFDTSASQRGVYRDDALTALKTMLASLNKADRVKLLAIDLNAIPLTDEFVAPDSPAMRGALEKLERRAPLGATDMAAGLRGAMERFPGAGVKPRSVVYIGGGASQARPLDNDELGSLIERLVERRLAVSSFAIGPRRDVYLLASLANHTGGRLYVDTDQEQSAQQAGAALAQFARATVFWPTSVQLPDAMQEVYPKAAPPLRSDRDTVLIGSLRGLGPHQISISAEAAGKPVKLAWTVTGERSQEDYGFLPQLVDTARADGGLRLPTVGSAALRQTGRAMLASAEELAKLSAHALRSGNVEGAQKVADAALERDPGNPQARVVRQAAQKYATPAGGAGNPAEPDLRLVNFQADNFEEGGLLREFEQQEGRFLDEVERRRRMQTQVIQAEVQAALSDARRRMATEPEAVRIDLKLLLETVQRAPELDARVRAQMRGQIESAIREAGRREMEESERRALAAESRAAALERQRLAEETARTGQRIQQLLDRFNALMDEGRYREAESQIAAQVRELDPDEPVGLSATWTSRFAWNITEMERLRDLRHTNFVAALYQNELALMPFPDEPPIIYPSPEAWEALTIRRRTYAEDAVDRRRRGTMEERIVNALSDDTQLEFIEAPLEDVAQYLSDLHQIPVRIDVRGLEEVGLTSDIPITQTLRGVTLRSALRLMLNELDLTYVVRDDVLQITTPERAEFNLITRVYRVQDLVVPPGQGGQLDPFQLGGGQQQGGQQQQQQQQQGGFGGAFSVEDDLSLGSGKNARQPAAAAAAQHQVRRPPGSAARSARIEVAVEPGGSIGDAWDKHFVSHGAETDQERFEHARLVRQTARHLMNQAVQQLQAGEPQVAAEKFDHLIAMIQAALRRGQPQPWMYEALALAMQASGAPQSEIERALMSAVDLSDNEDSMLYAAAYMARIGLDERALSLFQAISAANPLRPEPYLNGLSIAQRLNDVEGVQWACAGILSQAWPREHRSVEENARRVAEATLLELRGENRLEEAKQFQAAINQALVRDCLVRVTWTGDADVDILVEEPTGTICSIHNPRTTAGGVLLGDAFARPGGASAKGYSEVYVCPRGFSGEYRMLVRRVWGRVTAGKITLDIYTNYGAPNQKHIHEQIPLSEKDALVIFKLNEGRRTEPLIEEQVATVARERAALSRAILAQQLNSVENSDAVREMSLARRQGVLDNRFAPRGVVGFRPVIQTLPEGANFRTNAVISQDLRYVTVSPVPRFSGVADVTTFTFAN